MRKSSSTLRTELFTLSPVYGKDICAAALLKRGQSRKHTSELSAITVIIILITEQLNATPGHIDLHLMSENSISIAGIGFSFAGVVFGLFKILNG